MQRRHAVRFQGRAVRLGAIALMPGKTVFGIIAVEVAHEPVARDLGDDGSGGDGETARVAVNERLLPDRAQSGDRVRAVDKDHFRRRAQTRHGEGHGEKRGLEDIDIVDHPCADHADAEAETSVEDARKETLARLRRELFRISNTF